MQDEINPQIQELINELKCLVKTLEDDPEIPHWVIRKTLKTIIEKAEKKPMETSQALEECP